MHMTQRLLDMSIRLTHSNTRFETYIDSNSGIIANDMLIGKWDSDTRQFLYNWEYFTDDPDLLSAALQEANQWNLHQEALGSIKQHSLTMPQWLSTYPRIKVILDRLQFPYSLDGKNILDIGGSFKDMRYLFGQNFKRLDHIEVSAASQIKALNVAKAVSSEFPNVEEKIYFHNIFAENLPFNDNVFDFVFSRATIHHCRRPEVLNEIHRVLKPSGTMLLVERYLSNPCYLCMKYARILRNANRGSDDPLQKKEIDIIRALFSRVESHTYGAEKLINYVYGKRFDIEKNPLSDQELSPKFIRRLLSTNIVIGAIK